MWLLINVTESAVALDAVGHLRHRQTQTNNDHQSERNAMASSLSIMSALCNASQTSKPPKQQCNTTACRQNIISTASLHPISPSYNKPANNNNNFKKNNNNNHHHHLFAQSIPLTMSNIAKRQYGGSVRQH